MLTSPPPSFHIFYSVWYPLDFTFVCPTEITAFSDRKVEFDSLNTNVAVMSVDSKFSHLAWAAMPRNKGGLGKMSIPIISDITKKISSDYGVLIEDPQDPECGVACRGTVIIDSKGTVRHVSLSDLPVGRSVDEVLRLVAAFQHSDKHGEVCPAGWKTGSKTYVRLNLYPCPPPTPSMKKPPPSFTSHTRSLPPPGVCTE